MAFRRMLFTMLLSGLVLGSAVADASDEAASEDANAAHGLVLQDRIPRDPLLVYDARVGNVAERLEALFAFFAELDPSVDPRTLREILAEAGAGLGVDLRDDLLAQIGPEIALVVDLPPLDRILEVASDPGALARTALGETGLIMTVRDATRVRGSMRALLDRDGVEIVEQGELLIARTTLGSAADPPSVVDVVVGTRDGLAVLGFDVAWVRSALDGLPEGERLRDGDDFRRVFEHLDARPTTLTYVHLPEIRSRVEASERVREMVETSDELRPFLALLQDDDLTGLGVGSTTVEIGAGARTSTFGPSVWTGGASTAGMMLAIAGQNFLNAVDRGKQKRTMASIRSIAIAMESFAIDNDAYPVTEGWTGLEVVAESVEPTYIKVLPKVDGWDVPFLVWSDGSSYRIVSAGSDGEFERDWSGEIEPGPTATFEDDIVFADGEFMRWPEGALNTN